MWDPWGVIAPLRTGLTVRQVLAVDAAGAAVTSLLTAFVLAPGVLATGLPGEVLYALAVVAAGFCVLGVLFLWRGGGGLRVLALGNAGYALVTATLSIMHRSTLTVWGGAYFTGEIAILLGLAGLEWRAARLE